PTPAGAAEKVSTWDRLPEDQRRLVPPFSIAGSIYSAQPANRVLIIGSQLLHEGQSTASGIVVERIGTKSALLRWKTLRFEARF
ncbi:MAG: general secretion pathway protein GspB, partial [Burkholderiales bacterium]|nr:general secretion pathway protein GspB [Burkholderiales bacterium]